MSSSGSAGLSLPRRARSLPAYRLYEDTEIENDFLFVEEWESGEALRRHFATAHIAEFMRGIPEAIISAPDLRV